MNRMQVQPFAPLSNWVCFEGITWKGEAHSGISTRNPPTNSASVGQSRRRTEVVGSPQFNTCRCSIYSEGPEIAQRNLRPLRRNPKGQPWKCLSIGFNSYRISAMTNKNWKLLKSTRQVHFQVSLYYLCWWRTWISPLMLGGLNHRVETYAQVKVDDLRMDRNKRYQDVAVIPNRL